MNTADHTLVPYVNRRIINSNWMRLELEAAKRFPIDETGTIEEEIRGAHEKYKYPGLDAEGYCTPCGAGEFCTDPHCTGHGFQRPEFG